MQDWAGGRTELVAGLDCAGLLVQVWTVKDWSVEDWTVQDWVSRTGLISGLN